MTNLQEYIKKLQDSDASFKEQEAALQAIEKAILEAKKQKKEATTAKNASVILAAFKKIEDKLNKKYEELLRTPAMVGEQGPQGPAGKDGKNGKDGLPGRNGRDGKDGKDGIDGKDGVGVVDAKIDFDGSLVIYLSDGNEIDAGRVVAETVAKEFNAFMTRGEIIPSQSGNSGKYLTTDGQNLAWDQINISTSDISGVLPVTNGGTGGSTATAARINLLPSYASNGGKVLAVNSGATDVEWVTQSGGGVTIDDVIALSVALG